MPGNVSPTPGAGHACNDRGIKCHIIEKCFKINWIDRLGVNYFNNYKNKERFKNETIISFYYPKYVVAFAQVQQRSADFYR